MKLQAGEYVSLGRVETILSTSPFVDNMFVYGESSKNFVVAVVVVNAKQLALLAKEVLGGEAEGKTHEQLCKEERLEQEVQKRLVKQARHGQYSQLLYLFVFVFVCVYVCLCLCVCVFVIMFVFVLCVCVCACACVENHSRITG